MDETANEISEETFFTFLDRRANLLDAVTITGGEPTLHSDLESFIARIKEYGLLVKLDTNGTNPIILERLIKSGLIDYVAMDIKAPLSKYERVIARPVDIENIKISVNLLRNNTIDYEFRTTIVKSMLNFDDFQEIGKLIQGASNYYLQPFIPTKLLNPAFRRKACYTNSELLEIQSLMSQYVSSCQIR